MRGVKSDVRPGIRVRIGVLGAGAIGCYVGGRLERAGYDVVMVGRLGDEIAAHGLTLSDYLGARIVLRDVRYAANVDALADRDVVLVTVKSMATREAGASLAKVIAQDAMVVSLQNGVTNAEVLREVLPGRTVLAGMVPFNVRHEGEGRFHRGTSGPIAIERGREAAIAQALRDAGFGLEVHRDLRRIQWAKLLFNLNNSINALAGIPLRDELSCRTYRRVLARSMREGLACMHAAGIRPKRTGAMLPSLAPRVLALPNVLFTRIAASMIRIDASARSSMWEDLEKRRPTEIDFLNGEILHLSAKTGVPAPVNRVITDLVKDAERAQRGSPCIDAATLFAKVTR